MNSPSSATSSPPAFRDANVLRWLGAYAASAVGDALYFAALGWAAEAVTGPGGVGLVMAVGAVPRAILMLGGGVIADRFGPRRVVLTSDAVRCLVIIGVAAALALTSPGVWLLIAVALVFGVVDALFLPSVGALPPRITGPDQLVRVQGLRALVERVGRMGGPPIAGFAMAYGGPAAAFAVAGGLFAISLPLLVGVRIRPLPHEATPAQPTTAWRDLSGGLAYIRRHPMVGPLMVSGMLSQFGVGPVMQVGVILLAAERGWGAVGAGWIAGGAGLGAGLSALLLATVPRFPRAGAVQIGTLFVASAGFGAIGVMPTLAGAAAMAVTAGMVSGICGGLANALMQTSTDPRYLGRVNSVMALTAFGFTPMLFPLYGWAIDAWGATPVFVTGGAISMLGAITTIPSATVRRAELVGARR